MIYPKKILVCAPHTDDTELGCGGSLCKWIEGGAQVHYIAFSICEEWVPAPFPPDALSKEAPKAAQILGVKPKNISIFKYRATELWKEREAIFTILEKERNQWNPDLVLVPCIDDWHQDHACVAQEAVRVFKRSASILSYEIPWNNLSFKKDCYVRLEPHHIETKIKALECYDSKKSRNYISEDFIWSLAKVRGVEVGGGLAECFQFVRAIL